MRQEFVEYALLSNSEREAIVLPEIGASPVELNFFWSSINALKNARGEQPESLINSNPGALRGDIPFSGTERSEV